MSLIQTANASVSLRLFRKCFKKNHFVRVICFCFHCFCYCPVLFFIHSCFKIAFVIVKMVLRHVNCIITNICSPVSLNTNGAIPRLASLWMVALAMAFESFALSQAHEGQQCFMLTCDPRQQLGRQPVVCTKPLCWRFQWSTGPACIFLQRGWESWSYQILQTQLMRHCYICLLIVLLKKMLFPSKWFRDKLGHVKPLPLAFFVSLTDKALKETLDKMLLSGYFDRAQTHQNGVCEEETGAAAAAESSESEDRPAEPGKNKSHQISEQRNASSHSWRLMLMLLSIHRGNRSRIHRNYWGWINRGANWYYNTFYVHAQSKFWFCGNIS